jgi:hypothetical protein
MDSVVDGMVIVALVSALFSIFGVVLVIYSGLAGGPQSAQ